MLFCPQNSWQSFGTYICVNYVILDVPGRFVSIIPGPQLYGKYICWTLPGCRSVNIFGLNLSLAFDSHIWLVNSENEQHFAVTRSVNVAITFHIAFCINSQSDMTSLLFGAKKWTNSDSFALSSSYDWEKNVGWPWLSSLHCKKTFRLPLC